MMTLRKFQFVSLLAVGLLLMACSGPSSTSDADRFATLAENSDPTSEASTPSGEEETGEEETNDDADPTAKGSTPEDQEQDQSQDTDQENDLEPTPQGEPGPTENPGEPTSPPTDTVVPEPTPTQSPESTDNDHPDNVLPHHRVVSYYGHPSTGTMGILGEYSKEDLKEVLQAEAANYEAADPDKPVKMALELIATVAQPNPGNDGTYLLYTGDDWIGEYVDFTRENDMLLILDLQIGHDTIPNEINKVRHWLEEPHVHLALDPEFSTGENPMLPDRVPGSVIGEADGHHIQEGMEMVADIVEENDLPNKIFIVHQFESEMIYNKDAITPVEGVDFVLDMDGFGTPEAKIGNYGVFVQQELIQYGGIKLFYKQDDPLIDPATIVGLEPSPLVVIYQ